MLWFLFFCPSPSMHCGLHCQFVSNNNFFLSKRLYYNLTCIKSTKYYWGIRWYFQFGPILKNLGKITLPQLFSLPYFCEICSRQLLFFKFLQFFKNWIGFEFLDKRISYFFGRKSSKSDTVGLFPSSQRSSCPSGHLTSPCAAVCTVLAYIIDEHLFRQRKFQTNNDESCWELDE